MTVDVFSPRDGDIHRYTIDFTPIKLEIYSNIHYATCTINDGDEPLWSGYNDDNGNPLMQIFNDLSVDVPTNIPVAIEWAFIHWLQKSEMTSCDIESGLQELFDWIDRIARAQPSGTLWQSFF